MPDTVRAYPLILTPSYKDYLWGGQNILKTFNRSLKLDVCAESWEASDRDEGPSHIENGPFKGASLKALLRDCPLFFGEKAFKKFPLLIKLIDANKPLSIQVHPGNEKAKRYGGEAKSEMWHVLDAKKGSKIYLGFKKNLSEKEILAAIKSECLKQHLHEIEVKAGETYYIPGGLVHSIGEGCLIYEVQQNSNTTYRLYDWGRKDDKGAYRELHIKKALEAMSDDQIYLNQAKEKQVEVGSLLDTPFFTFNKLNLKAPFLLNPLEMCRVFFVSKGHLIIQGEKENHSLSMGGSFIVPANCENLTFMPGASGAVILETIPKHSE